MPTGNNQKGAAAEACPSLSRSEKSEIYAALYGLNCGIQQVLNSLDFLDKSMLGLPFLNGYRIVADEIRSAINFSTTEALSIIELRDYNVLEQQRMQMASSLNNDESKLQDT